MFYNYLFNITPFLFSSFPLLPFSPFSRIVRQHFFPHTKTPTPRSEEWESWGMDHRDNENAQRGNCSQ